jgi:two-component system cell cycle response regulator
MTCILAADGDPGILALVVHVLGRDGYEIVTAGDGVEALRLARERKLDLLLLDVSLPGLDGYAVCRELQVEGPSAPHVIFLAAHAHRAWVAGLDAGAVDCITKPFERDELRARVRAALRAKSVKDALAVEAATDALTGLLTRRQLGPRVRELVAGARRTGRPLACLMIDLDRFKSINDAHGHAAGDAVLEEVGRRLSAAKRESDVLIRYGGEEFLALLPETDEAGALVAAARFRSILGDAPVLFAPDGAGRVEIAVRASVGVACLNDAMADVAALVVASDEALYRAKSLGRDRVELPSGHRCGSR